MSSYQPYQAPSPTQPAPRTLTRSRDSKIIAGVCGGFAEYTGLDVNLVRIVLVAATVLGAGSPIIVYLAGWALMPEQPWPRLDTPSPSGSGYSTTDAAALRETSTESASP